jgi:hypothetical protein
MRTIGFRAKPKAVIFAIYDTEENRIINVESLKAPAALSIPEKLKHIRSHTLDLIREYNVKKAAIRTTESVARKISIERVQIEGVIQEAFASSLLENFCVGQIVSLAPLIGIERTDFKKYVDGEMNYEGVEQWADINTEEREAVFAALGAANV